MKYTKEMLEQEVPNCSSFAGLARLLNIAPVGSNCTHLKNRCKFFEIDTSHFLGQRHMLGKISKNKLCPKDILVVDRNNKGRESATRLKRAMIEVGVDYKCDVCSMGPIWLGNPILLQIDHINGVYWDNRLCNLRFICPNCHVQTETWGNSSNREIPSDDEILNLYDSLGTVKDVMRELNVTYVSGALGAHIRDVINVGKIHKVVAPLDKPGFNPEFSKDDLQKLLWELPLTKIGKKFNRSDNAIKRWVTKWDLSQPPKGYFLRKDTRVAKLANAVV